MIPMELGGPTIDTLTVQFFKDQPGPLYQGNEPPLWACHIGDNMIEGIAGFGETPLAALRDMVDSISRQEGHRTDNGKLFLR